MRSRRHAFSSQRVLALACAAVALCGLPPAGHATDSTLRVAAVVPRRADIRIEQPSFVTLTARDVERGWIEVSTPVQVVVRSNVPDGYTLLFEQHGHGMGEAQVLGLGAPLVLTGGQAMGARVAPARGYWTDQVVLRFRFAVPAGTQPGEQPWPVRISLLPP